MLPSLAIRNSNRRNRQLLFLVSFLLAMIALSLLLTKAAELSIVIGMLMLCSYLCAKIAFDKKQQPRYSLVLCHDHIQFHHRYGGWVLKWENIQRVDIPKLDDGISYRDMSYIGLRIKDYHPILQSMSSRLSAHLLTEQRPALLCALRSANIGTDKVTDKLIEDDYHKSASGKIYSGLVGMFGNRMASMRQFTGYDLLVDQSMMDESAEEVLRTFRRYQHEALSEQHYQ